MTKRYLFNIQAAHPSWHTCLAQALQTMDSEYLEMLYTDTQWLPGPEKIFNAFSLSLQSTRYVLFGESPYPRATSANGYAFWDAAVGSLWSETGLSKPVNRATSLRNIIKMLLIAEGALPAHEISQPAIAKLSKDKFIQTNHDLFHNFLTHGFLLLNATPILRPNLVQKDARAWHPFIRYVLNFILQHRPEIKLILLGNIANSIEKLINTAPVEKLYAEHPYNLSFIHNPQVIQFFRPLHLLVPG